MYAIREVSPNTAFHSLVLDISELLNQKKYLTQDHPIAKQKILLGAFEADSPVGFLLALIQVVGKEERCSPILMNGEPLLECYVEAFGVLPAFRLRGIGRALQERAMEIGRSLNCYQMRSRSPVTATENYQLKLKMGYAIHPSGENDSYYFIKQVS
jgi:GNAT superfamily N-acetyltransferase